ncbi:MAG: PEP/pyruvate-binding domain-containing protein [Gammaproteobacteria bacterium]
MSARLTVSMGEIAEASEIGGKAAALAALSEAGLPIPPWFALTVDAAGAAGFANGDSPAGAEGAVQAMLAPALAELGPGPYAVRSSAIDEDGRGHSFAGQLDSYLFVAAADVPARVVDVWRSGFSARLRAYRAEQGLADIPVAPAVLVQRMVDAEAAGVAFSADPVTGARGRRVVSAVPGLGSALVSGEADADTWHVDRDGQVIERRIVDKTQAHRHAPGSVEGVAAVALPEDQRTRPVLSDAQAIAVARLAERAEAHFGVPQDIEWALYEGRILLLQSRPITALAQLADAEGERIVWDNSNIAESYAGITTPLTFSFARRAYEEVYRQFCLVMGVPKRRVAAHARTFRNMLGLIRGRVYYNLNSWYRALALLPGFTLNRGFMEQMMGVREAMPAALVAELGRAGAAARLVDALYLARMVLLLVGHHLFIERTIRDFHARLAAALAEPRPPLAVQRLDELAAGYRMLEQQLLTRWDAPLINDFLAMIFHGVLRKLTARWCADGADTLHNDLLCGEGGMVSAEPARRIVELATLARPHPEFVAMLATAAPARAATEIGRHPDFAAAWRSYLERFGDRCMEELKLESATLHDDPTTLMRAVAQLARHGAARDGASVEGQVRATAEARLAAALAGHPWRRRVFAWVLNNARARVRDRENLRFERTRLFGRVRRILVEMGRRLVANGELDAADDVFQLEVEEVLAMVEGTATTTDLAALVAVRRREFARYRDEPAPAERFETRGAVHQGNRFVATTAPAPGGDPGGERVQGLGCCPGIVRAPVRVVRDPRGVVLAGGEILVAERTDPGWIMLFPACAGLLVERGSLLSHAAIVAREMGIPAIVSVAGVMDWLQDGEWVEMDGASGVARRIPPPSSATADAAAMATADAPRPSPPRD